MNKTENAVFYKKIEIIQNVAAEILNFLPAYAASVIVQEAAPERRMGMEGFWLPVLVLLFYYYLREVSERLPVFLLFHILPPVGILFFLQKQYFPEGDFGRNNQYFHAAEYQHKSEGIKEGNGSGAACCGCGRLFCTVHSGRHSGTWAEHGFPAGADNFFPGRLFYILFFKAVPLLCGYEYVQQ